MNLKDKVIIITGASGGIGEAVAKNLDEAGMKLVLTARSKDKLEKLASTLRHASVVPGEVTDPELPQRLLEEAINTFGQLDAVFNNAGVMNVGSIEQIDIEAVCQMVRINVESVFRLAYVALKHFKKTGSGFVINTSSISGLKTAPELAAYSGTKHAVEAFTDALRMELAGTQIGVASIQPGSVATGLYDHWEDRGKKEYILQERPLDPEDIARAVRFILEQPAHVRIPRLLIVPADQPV